MDKKSERSKEAILVTLGSFAVLVIAFTLYFLIFMLFETVANQYGSYRFVPPVRVGYGIVWIVFCVILYRTKVSDWIKASILTGSLATLMIGLGVQLFENPIFVGLVVFLTAGTAIFLLYKMKKNWYHYLAILIAVIAAIIYL